MSKDSRMGIIGKYDERTPSLPNSSSSGSVVGMTAGNESLSPSRQQQMSHLDQQELMGLREELQGMILRRKMQEEEHAQKLKQSYAISDQGVALIALQEAKARDSNIDILKAEERSLKEKIKNFGGQEV